MTVVPLPRWLKRGVDGEWHHHDGTLCPAFMASRSLPDRGHWWCTEHQQHVDWHVTVSRPDEAPESVCSGSSDRGGAT